VVDNNHRYQLICRNFKLQIPLGVTHADSLLHAAELDIEFIFNIVFGWTWTGLSFFERVKIAFCFSERDILVLLGIGLTCS